MTNEFRSINSSLCQRQRNCTVTRYTAAVNDDCCEVCLVAERDARIALVPCGHQRLCESCANEVFHQGRGSPICRAGTNMILRHCWCATILIFLNCVTDLHDNGRCFLFVTAIFIIYMDYASLVFRRCMCTLIVFLIFCNVFNWWCRV